MGSEQGATAIILRDSSWGRQRLGDQFGLIHTMLTGAFSISISTLQVINTDGVVITDAVLETKDIAKDLYTSARGDLLSCTHTYFNSGNETLLSNVKLIFPIVRRCFHFTFR